MYSQQLALVGCDPEVATSTQLLEADTLTDTLIVLQQYRLTCSVPLGTHAGFASDSHLGFA